MKLIQQSKLFFKEGTSDKVYEIDLCELSPTEYIVNFRYGRRGNTLKEGTKTPAAVTREKAEDIFSILENEKRRKGYQSEVEVFIDIPKLENINPESQTGSILQRLQDAIDGNNSFKTDWKTSRVIWKAGELGLKEAIPFIIKLATKGDEMQKYSSLYALTKLEAQQAEPLFQSFAFQPKQKAYIRHIACEGLLTILDGEELNAVVDKLLKKLPYELRTYIENNRYEELTRKLIADSENREVNYFTTLYLICKARPDLLSSFQQAMSKWMLDYYYFQQARAIYKLSQLRGDYATMAQYAYLFEKREANSQRPYARRTRKYLQRNSFLTLKKLGDSGDATEYLKYAISLLLQYKESDYTAAAERLYSPYGQYEYKKKFYYFTFITYPECYDSFLLSSILFGKDPARKLTRDLKFVVSERVVANQRYYYDANTAFMPPKDSLIYSPIRKMNSAMFDPLKSLVGKKKRLTTPPPPPVGNTRANRNVPPPPPSVEEIQKAADMLARTELYPEHWDAMPSAYIQLLIQAKMNVIHKFAYNNLKKHPDYPSMVSHFDKTSLLLLLNSTFEIPNKLGFDILEARKHEFISDGIFLCDILSSNSPQARVLAQSAISNNLNIFFEDTNFIAKLLANPRKENYEWINNILKQTYLTDERKQALLGKLVSELLQLENTDDNNNIAKVIIERINLLLPKELYKVSWDVVEELILSPLLSNIWLASNIIIEKSQKVYPTEIPLSAVDLFLRSDIPEVRQNGIKLFNQYPPDYLAKNINFVLNQTDSRWEDVVKNTLDTLKRLSSGYNTGDATVQHLVYVIMRKEKFEGSHTVLIDFITNELKRYWNTGLTPKDITKLINASYRESQLTGYKILTGYSRTNEFSLPQIISFGNHELIAVRSWCISYYYNNVERIRFEKDKSLNLLDAKWDDTREQAFQFFRTQFTEADWDVDTLITIVDSIRPDVQEFGKELIKNYVKPEDMLVFLHKLSEHPSVSIQSFISVYLNNYASGNIEIIRKLEYYFRSVLARVNKARVAKNRILSFLHKEALANEEAASVIVPVLDDMSAQSTVQDKERYILMLTEIKAKYPHLEMQLKIENQLPVSNH